MWNDVNVDINRVLFFKCLSNIYLHNAVCGCLKLTNIKLTLYGLINFRMQIEIMYEIMWGYIEKCSVWHIR